MGRFVRNSEMSPMETRAGGVAYLWLTLTGVIHVFERAAEIFPCEVITTIKRRGGKGVREFKQNSKNSREARTKFTLIISAFLPTVLHHVVRQITKDKLPDRARRKRETVNSRQEKKQKLLRHTYQASSAGARGPRWRRGFLRVCS